jgi:hypothetical protein
MMGCMSYASHSGNKVCADLESVLHKGGMQVDCLLTVEGHFFRQVLLNSLLHAHH